MRVVCRSPHQFIQMSEYAEVHTYTHKQIFNPQRSFAAFVSICVLYIVYSACRTFSFDSFSGLNSYVSFRIISVLFIRTQSFSVFYALFLSITCFHFCCCCCSNLVRCVHHVHVAMVIGIIM